MLQQYCLLHSFNNNTVYCSSKFAWVLRVLNSIPSLTPRGLYTLGVFLVIWLTPLFFEEHVLMLWLSILVSWLISILVIFIGGYEATPLQVARVSLLVGRSIPCQRGGQVLSLIPPDMGGAYPFHSPWFCLALPTVTQFHEWSHSSLGSLSAGINGLQCCSLCLTYVFLLRSAATSCYLWSSLVSGGCSSRHPW